MFPISGRSAIGNDVPRITGMLLLDSLLNGNLKAFFSNLRHLVLPFLTIAFVRMPRYARVSRAAMLNVLGEDYITTARAKGVKERRVIVYHAFRNAILPIITMVASSFVWLLGGTVIVEMIFSLPGMGRLLLEGLRGRDFNMIQGVVALYAVVVVIINSVVEVLYAIADPRVKY
jgi:peptide/nickel transport system permease protein